MTQPRRVEELLAERACQGLDAAEAAELQRQLAAHPDVDADAFDLAAAAIDLALTPALEPMPANVRQLVSARLRRQMGVVDPQPTQREASLAPVSDFARAAARRQPPAPEKRTPWAPWLAAAAALVLAVAGWWPRPVADTADRADAAGPADPRSALESVAAAPDLIRWAWSGTDDPAVGEAGGEVMWSGAEQRGWMRITGLAANDPGVEQYQLWIFDRSQDERYPVDGGVFDVGADGEALIPIDAKIAVDEPYLFAVTVERPGGVVVSSRERIVLLAQA